ncbi:MAG TPA: NAD-binding protein [Gemmataceae bacterium]|nr:NAD-binding protein [Gemmataceae bacterium]
MRNPTSLHVYARYVLYLFGEFRWALLVFWGLVLGGGLLLHLCYHHEGKQLGYLQACHAVFMLIFVQPSVEFPDEWYLQLLWFLLPIIGLGAVADSVVRLAYLVFTKKQKLPEWQRMVASLYRNHVVVVGVGKVGLQVIKGLVQLREAVVAIERKQDSPFVDEIQDLRVPVITGDARQLPTLQKAGVAKAKAVVLATDDDLTNLDAALTARDLNPKVRVVMRLFDDTLATKVGGAFQLPAISPSRVAAPAFIAAATGRKVYQSFDLDGKALHLTDLSVCATGGLVGQTVGDVQQKLGVNLVMHRNANGVHINPSHDIVLAPGDTVLVIAPMEQLLELEQANQPPAASG